MSPSNTLTSARYVSTRGADAEAPKRFCEILLEGLATDGGLYVPQSYPTLSPEDLERMRGMNYRDLAFTIMSLYIDDISSEDLRQIIDRTYTTQAFGSDDITPLVQLEPGLHLLKCSNGPTLAFKDVAMQFLGHLFEFVLAREGRELNILGQPLAILARLRNTP